MTPHDIRFQGVMIVREANGLWLSGALLVDPNLIVELSFEGHGINKTLPETDVTYIGVWHKETNQCWFEFQLGSMCVKPTPERWILIEPLMNRLIGYRPIQVEFDTFVDDLLNHRSSRPKDAENDD